MDLFFAHVKFLKCRDLVNLVDVLLAADPLPPDLAASLFLCDVVASSVPDLLHPHVASCQTCHVQDYLQQSSDDVVPNNAFASCRTLNDGDFDLCRGIFCNQVLDHILVEIDEDALLPASPHL